MQKRKTEQRSNSTKAATLTLLKSGVRPIQVSRELSILTRTLRDWREASMASGNWNGGARDNNNVVAIPVPRKKEPGTGTGGRKITNSIKKKIKRKLDVSPFLTPRGLQRVIPELRNVALVSIRRAICEELGIPSLAAKKPFLTNAQKECRLDWALRKRNWSARKWARVLWSDETHIELWQGFQCACRVRRPNTISRYDPNFVIRTVKHPPKLMIWGAFRNSKLGHLYVVEHNAKMNAAMYKEVLQKHLKASLNMTDCTTFMQDGAPCNTAGTIKEWLANHAEVPVLYWVGQSCDLNPIENLWHRLKKIIGSMKAASNLPDLAKQISRG